MAESDAVTRARHALGGQLAAARTAAGHSQHGFAPLTGYSRSTLANVETGRQHVARDFWERCDAALGTGGSLALGFDQIEAAIRREREHRARQALAEREARVRAIRSEYADSAALALGPPESPQPQQDRPPGTDKPLLTMPDSDQDAIEVGDSEESHEEGRSVKRRNLLSAGGVAAVDAALSTPIGVLQALDVVTSDAADTLGVATDCLNELICYYSEGLPVSPPATMYDDLLNIRSYAGALLGRARSGRSGARKRSDLLVAAGWLSNLLAVASSYMCDHGSALVWCVDAERRSSESGHPEIAGWAALTRAMMAYYQGRAARSIELASLGQGVAPGGTVVHAKLAAQEMRARAMLGDADGMAQVKRRTTKAIAELPSEVPTTGVFSIALSGEPPYTATSLLLVNRFREAASVTKSVIENVYPTGAQNRSRQSSSYARTLLILGLAEAGLGRVDEAGAVGRAALESAGVVWPTLVLAGKLDQVLMRDNKDATEAAAYHALYVDMAQYASTASNMAARPSRQGKPDD